MEQSDQPKWKPDIATVKDLAQFFRVDRTAVPDVMKAMAVPRRGMGYPWLRIWVALGLDLVTVKDPDVLKTPLLALKDVAAMLGENVKTTRRRSEGEHRDKSIPAHIDFGPRKRLYLPAEIQSWILGEPMPFERRQESLSFVPDKAKQNSTPKEKEPKPSRASVPSAVNMFMVPPRPN